MLWFGAVGRDRPEPDSDGALEGTAPAQAGRGSHAPWRGDFSPSRIGPLSFRRADRLPDGQGPRVGVVSKSLVLGDQLPALFDSGGVDEAVCGITRER